MIISIDDIVSMPDFIGQDTKILQKKLNALELLIRKYTNNNFQNRSIRFIGNSLGDRIFGGHPFIRMGDTIQISESEVNDDRHHEKWFRNCNHVCDSISCSFS